MKVEISGNYGEGKTTLALVIKQVLLGHNFNVELSEFPPEPLVKNLESLDPNKLVFIQPRDVKIVVRNDPSEVPADGKQHQTPKGLTCVIPKDQYQKELLSLVYLFDVKPSNVHTTSTQFFTYSGSDGCEHIAVCRSTKFKSLNEIREMLSEGNIFWIYRLERLIQLGKFVGYALSYFKMPGDI